MWQEQYGIESANVYSYDTMGDLTDNPDIHVVYIVTPKHVHMQYAIAAARAKKHVWCEKPMAMDVAECQAIFSNLPRQPRQGLQLVEADAATFYAAGAEGYVDYARE